MDTMDNRLLRHFLNPPYITNRRNLQETNPPPSRKTTQYPYSTKSSRRREDQILAYHHPHKTTPHARYRTHCHLPLFIHRL